MKQHLNKKSKKIILKSGVYKHFDLVQTLGSNMAVKRAVAKGLVEKISRGFYATTDIPTNKTFFLVIKKYYPAAVISKRTLMYHYHLTTDQPPIIDIDFSSNSKYRNSTDLLNINRTNKIFSLCYEDFNSVKLKCYSRERALFEVLCFEKKPGQLTAEVIQNYLANNKYQPTKIFKIAKKFGRPGLDLANLIHLLAETKFRVN